MATGRSRDGVDMSGMVPDGSDTRGRQPPPARSAEAHPDRAAGRDRDSGDTNDPEIVDLGRVTHATVPGRDRWAVSVAIVVGVVIVAVGIVLAGRPDLWVIAPGPSVAASPVESSAAGLASPSRAPSPRPSATPRRSFAPPSPTPCVAIGGDSIPDVVFRSDAGVTTVYAVNAGGGPPLAQVGWAEALSFVRQTEPPSVARIGSFDPLVLTTSEGTCLIRVEVTFADFHGAPPLAPAVIEPEDSSQRTFSVVTPGPGDWAVRLLVEFAGTGEPRWLEAYARVRVGENVAPPIQWVTPARPCGPGSGPADLALHIDDIAMPGWPWSGAAEATAPPSTTPVRVPPGSVIEARIAGDRCAATWRFEATRRATAGSVEPHVVVETYTNAVPDTAVAAQNRFRMELGLGPATWDVTGTVQLADGTTVVAAWVLELDGLGVPRALLVGRQDRSARVEAVVGNCVSIQLRNGSSGVDACGSDVPTSPLATLVVPIGSRLTFAEPPGWNVQYWGAATGVIRGEPPWFDSPQEGFLRSASSPPVDFPVPATPGKRTLVLNACLVRDGNQACGNWFVTLDVR